MREVRTVSGSTALLLPFDFGLVGLVGLAPVSSRRRFPRRGDSSTTLAVCGLAGVDDATGLNASIGEDWMILNVGMTRFGLVNTILRGDRSLREREAADGVAPGALIAEPLTGVRGNADTTGSQRNSDSVVLSFWILRTTFRQSCHRLSGRFGGHGTGIGEYEQPRRSCEANACHQVREPRVGSRR